jgi:hypothetical protein
MISNQMGFLFHVLGAKMSRHHVGRMMNQRSPPTMVTSSHCFWPRLPLTFVLVPEHATKRVAHEKRKEKKAIAADIEADPLANNDDPAREDLSEWIPPTFTGGTLD